MKPLSLNKILTSHFFFDHRLANDFHINWASNKDKKFWYWIVQQYNFFLKNNSRKQIVDKKIHQIWLGIKISKKFKDIVILPSQYFYPWPNFLAHNKENPHLLQINLW